MSVKYFPVIDMTATGRNISELRKARGLSVSALQEYFGFDAPQAIYKWQKGQTLPSTDNLYALSYLFGVSIEDILIPTNPRFQMLSQDESCDSDRFGNYDQTAVISEAKNILSCFNSACFLPYSSFSLSTKSEITNRKS